jgi:hypothetical protein
MTTIARLEKHNDGGSFWRVLCGKRDRHGDQRCPGPLCLLEISALGLGGFWMVGSELRDGAWRPVRPKAPESIDRQFREPAWRKQARRLGPFLGQQNIIEIKAGMKVPLAECPRCHKVNTLLNEADINALTALTQ